jgi:hypothetical protein
VIKVMASGGTMTPGSLAHEPQFSAGSLRAIADEAHRHGLPVVAHAHSATSIADALAAGIDGIEHTTFMTADGVDAPETVIRAIAARRIAVGWTVGRDPAHAGPVMPQIASRMPALIATRRRLYESGAVLVPGSDAGVTPAKPHDVLRFAPGDMAVAGLSPAEILQTMTSQAAQACGLGHRKGRIAAGFDADILAIDGNPFPAATAGGHSPRLTIGRTVWRRETWHIPPAQGPARPEGAASRARDLGLPRRVFVLSPGEIKPIYIDFGSPVLSRILCRQFRRAGADFPGRPLRFTEMLPGPEDCWLAGDDGQRYTSELRLVAVDLGRTAE